jgi:HK97 family phage major capsid protein
MAINDIIKDFNEERKTLIETRDALKEAVEKEAANFKALAAKTNVEPESAEEATKTIELGMFLQSAYKAKRGDYAAAKRLDQWNTKASTLIEGTDNLGGYTVPDELERTLVKYMEGASVLMPYCRSISMKSDTKNIPVLDGNVSVAFHAEGSNIVETNPTFDNAQLKTYRQDAFTTVSNELLEDSDLNTVDMLLSQFTEQCGQGLDDVILNGTGDEASAAHSGIFTAAVAYSTVMAAGSVNFSSVLVSNLVDLYHQVPSYAREKGIFVMHSDIAKYLQLEKDTNGQYRWNPYGAGGDMRIHGKYPIVETIKAPAAGDTASGTAFIAFGNFNYLAVGRRKGISFLVDPYTNAAAYQSRIIMTRRLALAYLKNGAFARLLTA